MTNKDNMVAAMMQWIGGLIFAAYGFRALVLISEFGDAVFDVFLQGIIIGGLFIGFGEVIKLMQGLYNQRETERPVEDMENARREALRETDGNTVSLEDRNRVMDHYTKNKIVVDDIEAAPYEGYAIVHHDGQRDIVDLNNWEIEVLTENQLRKNPKLKVLLE